MIVVASVSCIYGIGEVEEYKKNTITLTVGEEVERNKVMKQLIEMHYDRNDLDFKRGTFRVRGDVIEIIPTYENKNGIRVEFFGDEIDKISEIDTLTGKVQKIIRNITIFPASHFVTSEDKLKEAIKRIKVELEDRLKELRENNKLLEAERFRTKNKL